MMMMILQIDIEIFIRTSIKKSINTNWKPLHSLVPVIANSPGRCQKMHINTSRISIVISIDISP